VQIVAASNRDLADLAQKDEFRSDLYHRLSVFGLELPPLRDRRDDVEELLPVIVAEFNAKAGKSVRRIPDSVWAALKQHDWPGNVRELRNVVERCVLFSEDETFPEQWLQLHPARPADAKSGIAVEGNRVTIPTDGSVSLEEM